MNFGYSETVRLLQTRGVLATPGLDQGWSADARHADHFGSVGVRVCGHDIDDVALVQAARPDALLYFLREPPPSMSGRLGPLYLGGVEVQLYARGECELHEGATWRDQSLSGRAACLYERNGSLVGHVIRYAADVQYMASVWPSVETESFKTRKAAMEWVERKTLA